MKKISIFIISIFILFSAKSQVIISEIDYDNVNTDNNEKIEIFGPAGTNLSGWKLILYDGASGLVYNTTNLSGTIATICGSYGVIVISYPVNSIQDGSPDGVALVNAGGQVVEFLSYEGSFTATDGPAIRMTSTDILPGGSDSNTIAGDIERQSLTTWTFNAGTMGTCNAGLIPASLCTGSTANLTAFISQTLACAGDNISLNLFQNGYPGTTTFQWKYQNASTGYSFQPLGITQTTPAKNTVVTESTTYQCSVYCNGVLSQSSELVDVDVISIGTITTSFTVVCDTHNTSLSLTGLLPGVGYSYQWQKNVSNAGWANISGATGSTTIVPNSEATVYRCYLTICNGATTGYSSEVTPGQGNCYCLPFYLNLSPPCSDPAGSILQVKLNTLNFVPGCNSQYYYTNISPTSNLPNGIPTTNLNQGFVYTLEVALNEQTFRFYSLGVWIDYNDNYIFENSEKVADFSNISSGPVVINVPVSVPANALPGMHRLRIREVVNVISHVVPCSQFDANGTSYESGETEDYTVNITTSPACTGVASIGGTTSSSQTICTNSVPAPITLTGNTGSILMWQQSGDAAFTYPQNILTTANSLTIAAVTATTFYRAVVQNNNCAPAYSSTAKITVTGITATTTLATDGQGGAPYSLNGTIYYMDNCKLVTSLKLQDTLNPFLGGIQVNINATVQQYKNRPFVQRHYTMGSAYPSHASGSGVFTIYFLQSEFAAFNQVKGVYKSLPVVGSNADPNISNLKVMQYDNDYLNLTPATAIFVASLPHTITWNATNNWWEITFTPTHSPSSENEGLFYITTNIDCPSVIPSVSNISSTEATAFWNILPASGGFEYVLKTTNMAPTVAGTHTTEGSINLSGLTTNTNYYFFIRTDCGEGNFSAWTSANFFTSSSAIAKIGVGTTSPASNLEIAGTGIPDVRISSTNSFGPSRLSFMSDKGAATEWRPGYIESGNNGDYTGRLDFYTNGTGATNKSGALRAMSVSNGNLTVTGTVTANGTLITSDSRYKYNIYKIANPLNKLVQLRGTQYFYKSNAFHLMNFPTDMQYGVIAQEVEKIFPNLVSTNAEGYKSVNYIGLIPVMIESIKEQQRQIEELKQLINKLINK
ncbi:MAG: GEVED domain-containing protein [Ferruginibacter sp.]